MTGPVSHTNASSNNEPHVEIVGSVLALTSQTPGTERDVRSAGPGEWSRQLATLARAGFGSVDLTDGWLPIPLFSAAEIDGLGHALAEAGVTARGLNVSRCSVIDPQRGAANVEYSLRGVDAAVALGLPMLSIGFHPRLRPEQRGTAWFWEFPPSADDRSEQTWATAVTRVRTICDYAVERRITVSIELYEDALVCSAPDIARMIAEVGAVNLGINPDLGNTYRSYTPQREHWLQTLRGAIPHMDYWHLKNYTRSSASPAGPFTVAPTALGEGDIDYRLAVTEVLRSGYTGPLVVEHYGGDALHLQALGRDYLERLVPEVLADLAADGPDAA